MSKHQKTGNPVFDYRAAFRIFAERLQHIFMLGGMLCFVCGGLLYFFALEIESLRVGMGLFSLIGLALILVGAAWGFFWRHKLRQNFKTKFGPSV
ncbi:MAG: hypothetical protein V1899_00275 [Planctomycetota bacterium]